MTVSDYADEIESNLTDEDDVSRDEIEDDVSELVNQYQVPPDEAINTVTRRYQPDDFTPGVQRSGEDTLKDLGDITEADEWVSVKVNVIQEWEPFDDSPVTQVGLIGDATGSMKYVTFSDNLPQLEEGKSYHIQSAVTDVEDEDDYDVDDIDLKLVDTDNVTTTIEEIDDVEDTKTFTVPIVSVKEDGSGLVKRCSEDDCNKRLKDGGCRDHGTPDDGGESDFAIKAVSDDGVTEPKTLYFGRDAAEEATGMTFGEAEDIFQTSYSNERVVSEIRDRLEGNYVTVSASGSPYGWYVDDVDVYEGEEVTEDDARDLAEHYRSVLDDPEIPEGSAPVTSDGPRRQNAVRVLAAEYQQVDEQFSVSDDDRAPNFALLPTGGRASRVMVSGTATEVGDNEDDTYTSLSVVDQSSHSEAVEEAKVSAGTGDWDAALRNQIRDIETPEFVTVVGGTNVFDFEDEEDGSRVRGANIDPEVIAEVGTGQRDKWTVETLHRTLERIEAFLAAEEGDLADVDRAKNHYGDDISDLIAVVRDTIEHIVPADVAPDLDLPDAPDIDAAVESDDTGSSDATADGSEGTDSDVDADEPSDDKDPEQLGQEIAETS